MPREDREKLILDVAGQVFARGDYHSSSMDEIAALAEISKPMLYTYFGSKEGLYLAYLDQTGGELVDRLRRAASPDDSPLGRLRARILEFLAFVEEYRDGWIVLFRGSTTSSAPVAAEVAELRLQVVAAVREMVEDAVPEPIELPPLAADGIAHAIVGAGESLANWWLEHPEVPRENVADWYVGVVQAAVSTAIRRRG
ncbi:MAG TPA: TetR/AcrR family transcriptional regulator [Solirubrobacteraceae bacterium]|jgi:AcrR family transcriptional regulator